MSTALETEFAKLQFVDVASTTSDSDSENIEELFTMSPKSDKYAVFDLDGGDKYSVNVILIDCVNYTIAGKSDARCLPKRIIFTQNDIITILTSLRDHPDFVKNLRVLEVFSPRMDDTCCNVMIDLFEELEFPCLTVFSLYGCSMVATTFRRLMAFVAGNSVKTLEEFTIGRMFIGDDEFIKAHQELDLGAIDSIQVILFPEIGLTDKSCDIILSYLTSDKIKNLKILGLSNNKFSDSGKQKLLDAASKRKGLNLYL